MIISTKKIKINQFGGNCFKEKNYHKTITNFDVLVGHVEQNKFIFSRF